MDNTNDLNLTAGAWLRQHREAAHISLEALSVALKVRPGRLQALESDQLAEMPDDLFVRSLALGICRHLKADEQALLPLLPQSPQRDLRVGRNQTHSNPYNPNRWNGPMLFSPKRWLTKWYAGGLVIALLILLMFVWPATKDVDPTSATPAPISATGTEGVQGFALPTATQADPILDTPSASVSEAPMVPAGSTPMEVKLGKPHTLAENVVITPVIPMALKQNLQNLPTQTTKP